jgi:hypothetical protein
VNLVFITPRDVSELEAHWDALDFLETFLPWGNYRNIAASYVPCLTLVYSDSGIILAAFTLELNKRSAELHGVCRQDLPQRSIITQAVVKVIFDVVFKQNGKDVLVIKVPKDSKGGKGFARLYGFERIQPEKGMMVYKLTKERYEQQA